MTNFSYRTLAGFWVKTFAKRITERVEGKNRKKDGGGRKEDQVRISAHGAPAVLRQGSPTCAPVAVGVVDAEPDKAHRRFRENRCRDAISQCDDDWSHDVGQYMAYEDSSS